MESSKYIEKMQAIGIAAQTELALAGFATYQSNGQRISINLRLAEHAETIENTTGNEVFIGHLPRDAFEHELLGALLELGQVFKIRWMMDFSGSNRGFGFVKYVSPAEAQRAVTKLNNFKMRPDCEPIGAKMSTDNKGLTISNLPEHITARCLVVELEKYEISGIVGAIADDTLPLTLQPNPASNRKPAAHVSLLDRGKKIHIIFESHQAATKARRQLLPFEAKMCGRILDIDWAKARLSQPSLFTHPAFYSNRKLSSPFSLIDFTSTNVELERNNLIAPNHHHHHDQLRASQTWQGSASPMLRSQADPEWLSV